MPESDVFGDRSSQWAHWQQTPWGKIRYVITAEILRRQIPELSDRKLRVLDAGGGDGSDSIPLAAAGHDVTIVDSSTDLLQRAAARVAKAGGKVDCIYADLVNLADVIDPDLSRFDVVLCHNVLQYCDDPDQVLHAVSRACCQGGAISVMAQNPASDVYAALLRRADPVEALELLDAPVAQTRVFDHTIRRLDAEAVRAKLTLAGFEGVTRFGVRCAIDFLSDDDAKVDPAVFDRIVTLELALADRDPYRQTARMWQLVARQRP